MPSWPETSDSRARLKLRCAAWWTAQPGIVAEALVSVPDPLLTALHPGPPASGAHVAGSLARSLAPAEAGNPAPAWLLPEQVRSFRRLLAAVRRYAGAVLADPVGSGKTYVALAVAATVNRGATACLVPATLLTQWKSAAAQVGVPVALCSHERVSRGELPQGTRGLVILDESHHFRNPTTRRYRHAARWLVGRPGLLVTATPVVNRVGDLASQLLLAVRDDALVLDGVASLRQLLAGGCAAPALGQLIIESDETTERRPRRSLKISRPTRPECAAVAGTLEMLGRLRLSRSEPIAALVRGVLFRAAGSSPAALEATLRRYRRLLLHARDALQAGRPLDRAELRRFTAQLGDQLVWWELMPAATANTEMELSDLAELDELIRAARIAGEQEDGKVCRLRDIVSDGAPSLVFAASRDTVRYLRDRLGDLRPAWCTGERAGIGPTALPRHHVLGWFRESVSPGLAPRHLIVTDVAAEGLDLQRAARVVHYDLPWTPMRMEQREGRSVRYGSRHQQVEVVRFAPPPALERSLGLDGTLAKKSLLPARAGLGASGRHLWRWRTELADRFRHLEALPGTAAVTCPDEGLLAGFALYSGNSPVLLCVLWLEGGGWTEAPDIIAARLAHAAEEKRVVPLSDERLKRWLSVLAEPIRDRLVLAQGRRWVVADPAPAARRLASRLQSLIREAALKHQAVRLVHLERALRFVAGGHTAGEAALIERLAGSPAGELAAALTRLPAGRGEWNGVEVRLTGLVVFGRDPSAQLP